MALPLGCAGQSVPLGLVPSRRIDYRPFGADSSNLCTLARRFECAGLCRTAHQIFRTPSGTGVICWQGLIYLIPHNQDGAVPTMSRLKQQTTNFCCDARH
jgi:hypothetical protein